MEKKSGKKKAPRVNPELHGLDLKLNKFGKLVSTVSLDELNGFLNKHVKDRKLEEKFDSEQKQKKKKSTKGNDRGK